MTSQGGGRIVVGVDGSPLSVAALRWAVRQARLAGSSVDAVIAWWVPLGYGAAPVGDSAVDFAGDAAAVLDGALKEAGAEASGVVIRRMVAEGDPAEVLARTARGADLLVVGGHGRRGFSSGLLGSVSQQCARHASCPVLVLRDDAVTDDRPA